MESDIKSMQDVIAEEIQWLWWRFIPFGEVTILQGEPGDGKTTVSLSITADVTRGRALPGQDAVAPINVLYQTREDGYGTTIKPRLIALDADLTRIDYICEKKKRLTLSDVNRIESRIIETGAKLLIFDSFLTYLDDDIPINSADKIYPLINNLNEVAGNTGCAIVIIGHLNKGSGKPQHRGLGSIASRAGVRSVVAVGRTGEYTRAVVQDKSNLAPHGKAFEFELDPDTWFHWLGECDATIDDIFNSKPVKSNNRPESQMSKAKRFIQTMLSNGEAVAAKSIIDAAINEGISESTLTRAKDTLNVLSEKIGNHWYWQLPVDANSTDENEVPDELIESDDSIEYEDSEEAQESQEVLQSHNTGITPADLV